MQTISELLQRGRDDATFMAAPGRKPLTYKEFRRHVTRTGETLNHSGIGRNDVVAIVLPDGPEIVSACISIAASATAAPLYPAYREKEFFSYLSNLKAKLLVVEKGNATPAPNVARELGIPIAELAVSPGTGAGSFELAGETPRVRCAPGPAEPDDVALVLHTSGTTSRPKIVPLSQVNVSASARNIAHSLSLCPEDRCLNIMPLSHVHGLVAAVLASLGAGASVYCTPGFNGLRFFSWMKEARPTWYTAAPTMHQAILTRAERNREIVGSVPLRFLRSSSASLAPQLMEKLESVFKAPVIEAYGLTEAAHQVTSNPLPPGERRPGFAGVPAGPEVTIIDDTGHHLPRGSKGEVVIRGPNVTRGYRNDPEANASSFTAGWFRTGDEGVMTEDGYLRLTGRLKEIINRGGEKISPREVEEVLMEHPAVMQAVTFPIPHHRLGEEVAAAVVCEGSTATEKALREFVGRRLADFKVPRRILFLNAVPYEPTGKLHRVGMAERLGLGGNQPIVSPDADN